MVFGAEVNIPAGTTEANPISQELHIMQGLIYRVSVYFPDQCKSQAKVAIFDAAFQLWPSTPGVWFHGNDCWISYPDMYIKKTAPNTLIIKGFNTDDTYEHSPTVHVALVDEKKYQARFMPHLAWEDFEKKLSEILFEQEEIQKKILEKPFTWVE